VSARASLPIFPLAASTAGGPLPTEVSQAPLEYTSVVYVEEAALKSYASPLRWRYHSLRNELLEAGVVAMEVEAGVMAMEVEEGEVVMKVEEGVVACLSGVRNFGRLGGDSDPFSFFAERGGCFLLAVAAMVCASRDGSEELMRRG
jgi:hypothetical protein